MSIGQQGPLSGMRKCLGEIYLRSSMLHGHGPEIICPDVNTGFTLLYGVGKSHHSKVATLAQYTYCVKLQREDWR